MSFFKKVCFIFLKIKRNKCFVDFNFELGQYLSKNQVHYAKKCFMEEKYEHYRKASMNELVIFMYECKNWSERIEEKFNKKRLSIAEETSLLLDLRVELHKKNSNIFSVKKRVYD